MTRRSRRAVLLVLATVLVAGCGGPMAPFEVGVKDYPSDAVIGEDPPLAPPPPKTFVTPLPPVSSVTSFVEGFVTSPSITPMATVSGPGSTQAPPACPDAGPFEAAKIESPNTVKLPPAAATYGYRVSGTFESTGAKGGKQVLPVTSGRVVTNVKRAAGGTFTYDVVAILGSTTTTTGYILAPEGSTPPPGTTRPGIYIQRVTTIATGTTKSTSTTPPLLLVPFPIEAGAQWNVAAVDPVGSTSITYRGDLVQRHQRVDACGTVIDAVVVQLTGRVGDKRCVEYPKRDPFLPGRPDTCADPGVDLGGRSSSADKQVQFLNAYAVAPQFGGIVVQDNIDVLETFVDGTAARTKYVATASQEPPLPKDVA